MKQADTGDFHLEKWYLDCVTEKGEAVIAYAARLKWRKIALPFSSLIRFNVNSGTRTSSNFWSGTLPQIAGPQIKVKNPGLNFSGVWIADAEALQATIFENKSGKITWNCYQPRSKVHLKINGQQINSLGYAEMLDISIRPWEIPMENLRWGRFINAKESLVWIQISEKEEFKWVWFNGNKIENTRVTDNRICLPDKKFTLYLDKQGEIESEQKIYKTINDAVSLIPRFNKWIPKSFLFAHETKWLSRGILQKGDVSEEGWALHEWIDFTPQGISSFPGVKEKQIMH